MTKQKDKIKLSSLQKNKNNPRYITADKLEKLKASIESFEQMLEARPIVTDEDGVILGGNMRYEALKALGYKEIPAAWVKTLTGLTDEQKREFLIKDNVGFGAWDWDTLANEWESELLTDWGLDVPVMEYEEQTELEAKEDDYQAPENMKIDVMQGDLIEFKTTDGRTHRLLCGDSTNSDDVEKLMNGEKADICFTSPPYNQGNGGMKYDYKKLNKFYEEKTDKKTKKEYFEFCISVLNNISTIIKNNAAVFWNVCYNANSRDDYGKIVFSKLNPFKVYESIIWDKIHGFPTASKGILSRTCEFIFLMSKDKYFTNQGENEPIHNVWRISSNGAQHQNHKACYPVELVTKGINLASKEKDIIFDPFTGSGSTLVAAHQLKRTCYGLELEPKYCQVIIDRMQKLDNSIKVTINGKAYEQQAEKIPF
jgi:site-specific DNA-methyltransferase (adenine-specific)